MHATNTYKEGCFEGTKSLSLAINNHTNNAAAASAMHSYCIVLQTPSTPAEQVRTTNISMPFMQAMHTIMLRMQLQVQSTGAGHIPATSQLAVCSQAP
jgi:hypothetical protein